jgi:hypothetical protein
MPGLAILNGSWLLWEAVGGELTAVGERKSVLFAIAAESSPLHSIPSLAVPLVFWMHFSGRKSY